MEWLNASLQKANLQSDEGRDKSTYFFFVVVDEIFFVIVGHGHFSFVWYRERYERWVIRAARQTYSQRLTDHCGFENKSLLQVCNAEDTIRARYRTIQRTDQNKILRIY